MRLTGGTARCPSVLFWYCPDMPKIFPTFCLYSYILNHVCFFLFRFRCMRVMTCVSPYITIYSVDFFFTTPASMEEFKSASLCSSVCPTTNKINIKVLSPQ